MRTVTTGSRQQGKTFAALQHLGTMIVANGYNQPLTIGLSRHAWRALKAALQSEAIEWPPVIGKAISAASDDATEFQACGITFKISDGGQFEEPK